MIMQHGDEEANNNNNEYKKQWCTKHNVFGIKTTNRHGKPEKFFF